jgi:type I restriction enzyme M protein
MPIKKSELYSSLWASCDELRGGMDASQYKDYVLVLLFVKYVSDRYAGQPYAPVTVPAGASFADLVKLKGTPDIGDQINKRILAPLAKANQLFTLPDFNDEAKLGKGKDMVERLTNLVSIFQNPGLDFSKNRADGDDLLGDAYEYLMRHFATESGKSKGQFYTPAEVSRVMAQILGIREVKATGNTTVYDPTCGSGSLLLKVGAEAAHAWRAKVTLYGQEKDNATAGLAKMNMILHDYGTASIQQGNTLAEPLYRDGEALKTFDYVVANPPFSDKRWSNGVDPEGDPFLRFKPYGVPPAKQGDYAYLLHILRSMKAHGKGACILPHGVLFRGGAEGVIRRNLVARGYVKGIIGLPANLFYGTGIPACIVVLDKEGAAGRKALFLIDASKGFMKDGPKNRLREQDIHKIVDTFTREEEIPGYSRRVPVAEIADPKNDFNLNLPRYIDSSEAEDLQDLDGHLNGGIPERDLDGLEEYWQVLPGVRAALFESAGRPGYARLKLPIAQVKPAIFEHAEFTAFNGVVRERFTTWQAAARPRLLAFGKDGHPKELIETIAEELLATFRPVPLIAAYDVYQRLMDAWAATMQDDCYLISAEGWQAAAKVQPVVEDKEKKSKAVPDLVVGRAKYVTELIQPRLVIGRFFAAEQAELDRLEAAVATLAQQVEEWAEEHGGEEGLLAEAQNEKGKVTRASVAARLRDVRKDADAEEERQVLERYLELVDQEAAADNARKLAELDLSQKVLARYETLTEAEVKTLVVEDKWLATLAEAIQAELDRVSQTLTTRIRQLAERYATPLPSLLEEVETLSARVDEHLQKMGLSWN